MNKTYPIGTKVKYIGYCGECKDKIGKVVEVYVSTCTITLPQSTCITALHGGGEIRVPWSEIIPVVVKNQQLLFDFME